MSRQFPLFGLLAALAVVVATGCHPQQPIFLHEDGDLSHYKGVATEIEFPDVDEQSLGEVDGAMRPFSLDNSDPREVWDLTLEEAVRCALENGKVLKKLGGQVNTPDRAPDALTGGVERIATIYDPAITETNPRGGIEAALSAFDAQASASLTWEKNDTPRNSPVFAGAQNIFPRIFRQDTNGFQAQISKTAATGGTWTIRHNVNYDRQEDTSRLFISDWNVNLEAEMRHPLLQGAGVQYNRIAGPGAIPGFNNGVVIARINTDIALADFEAGVRDLVRDVELEYWKLYFQYRNLAAVVAGRDSGLRTWREVKAKMDIGAEGGDAHTEAQSRQQYFQFVSAVEEGLNNLYETESTLRYFMGLAATDGRLIRPIDEPTTAKVSFDWHDSHSEALCRSVDLRRQKWTVKRRQLEMISAKNYLLPRFDAIARYRWLGMGDDLIDTNNNTGNPFDNAYESMNGGDFQEWTLGFEFSMPIGFRKEMAGVRHAQLNLARERARLQEMELEVSHQLSFAIREMESDLKQAQTNYNKRVAAEDEIKAAMAKYEVGVAQWTFSEVLDAQRRLAVAESEYYRKLVDYNHAISEVHYRKGSLLEYNGIQLAEGPWAGKAYFDAHRRARERDASYYLDYGFTRPNVISRGEYNQQAGGGPALFEGEYETVETLQPLEAIQTPVPEPATGNRTSDRKTRISHAADEWSPVRSTSYEEPASAAKDDAPKNETRQSPTPKSPTPKSPTPRSVRTKDGSTKWTALKTAGTSDELSSTSSTVEADRSTPGWKGVQR